jgi:hypothetical protein
MPLLRVQGVRKPAHSLDPEPGFLGSPPLDPVVGFQPMRVGAFGSVAFDQMVPMGFRKDGFMILKPVFLGHNGDVVVSNTDRNHVCVDVFSG